MAEKMLDSTTRAGMTKSSSSSHLPSIYGNGSLELVWQNGQILVHGGSSSATRNTPSCMRNDEDACIAKSARLNTLHSPLDFPLQRDSYLPHQNNDQTKSSIKLKDGCANLRPTTIENGNYLCTPSTQECSPSAPLKKLPIIDSSQTPVTNSQKQDLGKVNFSKVLRPSRFLKSTYQGNSATLHTNNKVLPSVEQIKITKIGKAAAAAATSSKALDHSVVIESSKGSHGFTGLKGQTPKEPLPDEYSEAGHKNALHGSHAQYYNKTSSSGAGLRAKGKADINSCNEPLLESFSVCSLGASNNTNLFSMKHEDTDDSIYSSDNYEEPEDMVKEKPAWEGTRTRVKRSRDAVIHNLNERKRRDKINKKMRVLKELIPNCNKVDKASMLDDAIQYLQTLKFQLQIMSMGTGLCMPLMMLPTAAHHMMTAPRLPQLMGAGMGLRPGTNIPCSLPQFPIPPLLGGTTDNTVGMFGFPDQVPPMPMSHAPFMPMFGNPSAQSLFATSTATNLAENLASAQFPNNSYLIGQAQYATKQAPDQVLLHH